MNDNETSIESLLEKAETFGRTSIELIKLNAIEKSADVFSSMAKFLVLALIATLCFTIFNIGISLWIGDLLGKPFIGFFLITGFYTLLGVTIYIFRNRWIKYPVSNSIINQLLKHDKS